MPGVLAHEQRIMRLCALRGHCGRRPKCRFWRAMVRKLTCLAFFGLAELRCQLALMLFHFVGGLFGDFANEGKTPRVLRVLFCHLEKQINVTDNG